MDYCYFVNVATVIYLLWFPDDARFESLVYAMADGPLAGALVAWQCPWVFGSIEHEVRSVGASSTSGGPGYRMMQASLEQAASRLAVRDRSSSSINHFSQRNAAGSFWHAGGTIPGSTGVQRWCAACTDMNSHSFGCVPLSAERWLGSRCATSGAIRSANPFAWLTCAPCSCAALLQCVDASAPRSGPVCPSLPHAFWHQRLAGHQPVSGAAAAWTHLAVRASPPTGTSKASAVVAGGGSIAVLHDVAVHLLPRCAGELRDLGCRPGAVNYAWKPRVPCASP